MVNSGVRLLFVASAFFLSSAPALGVPANNAATIGASLAGQASAAKAAKSGQGLSLDSSGGNVEKPLIIDNGNDVIVYSPMTVNQQMQASQRAGAGLGAATISVPSSQTSNAYWEATMGADGAASISLLTLSSLDTNGAGYLDADVVTTVLGHGTTLANADFNATRTGFNSLAVSGWVMINGQYVWSYSNSNLSTINRLPPKTLINAPLAAYAVVVPVYGVPVTIDMAITLDVTMTGSWGLNTELDDTGDWGGGYFNVVVPVTANLATWGGVGDQNLGLAAGVGGNVALYQGGLNIEEYGETNDEQYFTGGPVGEVCFNAVVQPSSFLNGEIYANYIEEFPGTSQAISAAQTICNDLGQVDPGAIVTNFGNVIANVGNTASQYGQSFMNSTSTLSHNIGTYTSSRLGGLFLDGSEIETSCNNIVNAVGQYGRIHQQYTFFKWPGTSSPQHSFVDKCSYF